MVKTNKALLAAAIKVIGHAGHIGAARRPQDSRARTVVVDVEEGAHKDGAQIPDLDKIEFYARFPCCDAITAISSLFQASSESKGGGE
ncbi:hypothetical protein C8J56DRAFT_1065459 [Mycena floridula]|nr:hypothetical protein C8J56DRAFT_1065459 [Mycena floridula]